MDQAMPLSSLFADPALRRRVVSAWIVVLIEAAIIGLLLAGSAEETRFPVDETVKIFNIAQRPDPVELVQPRRAQSHRREGAASPPNLRSKATEIVAPLPIVVVPVTSVIPTSIKANIGAEATSGAAPVAGPGTGAGGVGTGTGSGGAGDGDGDGGIETPPRLRRGRLKDSDYPKAVGEAGVGGTVSVKYLVGMDGRVADCTIAKSSGNAELDAMTCRLITERFRFDPSRDAAGRPVPAYIRENHSWSVEDDPPLAPDQGR